MPSADRLAKLFLIPLGAFVLAFFLLPMVRLVAVAGSGPNGLAEYLVLITNPRHFGTLIATLLLSATATLATLAIGVVVALFLGRNRFPGQKALIAMLTLPLAFPGVVVGFMIILLAGRQGLIGSISQSLGMGRMVFAYSMAGLFAGYVYFSLPRVMVTLLAAVEKLDPSLEEAARSLGASRAQVLRDVILPGIGPSLMASGAIAFATAMGAFGTAFTLATRIDVLAMTIYTEFTLSANFASAAALSIALGLITWGVLALTRNFAGDRVAAAG
ncbi:ABC transporter permease [Azorhizobium oxalatiphilum]|uniref:ABC transporter permease n=1 Tax=Azorhizobium oxalatiphilum TaxID=980631 RepID=A0A917F6P0_9HYPH|nr:ABC transporter permease [Azorhizobium oxalatiphilum]GGF48984.1 ABC transporter permease [Azorhizobium oxalatiphilum]